MRHFTGFPLAVALVAMAMLAVACDQVATSPDQVALEPPMLMGASVLPPYLAHLSVIEDEIEDEIKELVAHAAASGNTVFLSDDATGGDCVAHGTWDDFTKTCTLTGDVFDAINFNSPGLTLDCAGHQVNGGGSLFVAVFIFADNATVTKCEITGFRNGAVPLFSDGHSITDNSIHDNAVRGILLLVSNDNRIHDNSIHDNGIGIQVRGNDNLIAQNHLSGSGFAAIRLGGTSSRNVVEENTIDTGDFIGINLAGGPFSNFPFGPFTGPTNNVIRNNQITMEGFSIFLALASNENRVEGNHIVNASGVGIYLDVQANRNTFVSNRIEAGGTGFSMQTGGPAFPSQVGSDDNVFLDNVIRAGRHGFFIGTGEAFSPTAFRKIATGNRLEGNKISMTAQAGILIHSADDTDVTRNVVRQAGTNSLRLIDSPTTDVWLNDFSLSEGTPVTSNEAIELSVDGLGNWWHGNCLKGLFVAGVDSNSPDVVDSNPFNHPVAHIAAPGVLPPKACP